MKSCGGSKCPAQARAWPGLTAVKKIRKDLRGKVTVESILRCSTWYRIRVEVLEELGTLYAGKEMKGNPWGLRWVCVCRELEASGWLICRAGRETLCEWCLANEWRPAIPCWGVSTLHSGWDEVNRSLNREKHNRFCDYDFFFLIAREHLHLPEWYRKTERKSRIAVQAPHFLQWGASILCPLFSHFVGIWGMHTRS